LHSFSTPLLKTLYTTPDRHEPSTYRERKQKRRDQNRVLSWSKGRRLASGGGGFLLWERTDGLIAVWNRSGVNAIGMANLDDTASADPSSTSTVTARPILSGRTPTALSRHG